MFAWQEEEGQDQEGGAAAGRHHHQSPEEMQLRALCRPNAFGDNPLHMYVCYYP